MRRLLTVAAASGLLACAPPPAAWEQAEAPLRPDSPGNREAFRFDPGDVVEAFDSPGGSFRIWFTRSGPHAVPGADAEGTPASVLTVAQRYDEVAAFYEGELGFRPPLADDIVANANGGDARFDVYLVDFGGVGDGHYTREACLADAPSRCAGYMAQENDFRGYNYPSLDYAVRILASHEYFHAVQAAYDADQGSVLAEGTAVWATEQYDPSLSDFEAFVDGYLENPDRPLDEPLPGPVDAFSYGAGLVFQFLSERHGREIIPALWALCEDGAAGAADPYWVDVLDGLLQASYDSRLADEIEALGRWNLFTGPYADPEQSYAQGANYPAVKTEIRGLPMQDQRERYYRLSNTYYEANPGDREALTAALVGDADDLADLRLFLAPRGNRRQLEPIPLDLQGGTVVPVGADWTTAVLWVSNGGQADQSRRPGVCFGSPAEVEACFTALGGTRPEPEPDAGPADLGPAADMGAPPSDAALPDASAPRVGGGDDDGGCRAAGGPAALGLWAVPLLVGLRRRRRG